MAGVEVHDPTGDSPADGVRHIGIGPVGEFPAREEAEIEQKNGEFDAGE